MGKIRWTQEELEKFVIAWQKADTVSEVDEQFGLKKYRSAAVASNLRKKGIPLKKMRGISKLDLDRLIELASPQEKESE